MFENFKNEEEHDDFATAFASLFGQEVQRNEFAGPPPVQQTPQVETYTEPTPATRLIGAVVMSMPQCNTDNWSPEDYSLLYMVQVWIGIPAVSAAAGLLIAMSAQDKLFWFVSTFCMSYIINWYAITAIFWPSADGIALKTMQRKAQQEADTEAPEMEEEAEETPEVKISADLPPVQGEVIDAPGRMFNDEQRRIFRLFEVGDIVSRRTVQQKAAEIPGYDPFTEYYAGRFTELTEALIAFGFVGTRGQSKVWDVKGHAWSRNLPHSSGE